MLVVAACSKLSLLTLIDETTIKKFSPWRELKVFVNSEHRIMEEYLKSLVPTAEKMWINKPFSILDACQSVWEHTAYIITAEDWSCCVVFRWLPNTLYGVITQKKMIGRIF
jgi:hypothetical protein